MMLVNNDIDVLIDFSKQDIDSYLENIISEYSGYIPNLYYSPISKVTINLIDCSTIKIYNGSGSKKVTDLSLLKSCIDNYVKSQNIIYLSGKHTNDFLFNNSYYIDNNNINGFFEYLVIEEHFTQLPIILSVWHTEIINYLINDDDKKYTGFKDLIEFMIYYNINLNIVFSDVLKSLNSDSNKAKIILDSFKSKTNYLNILANKYLTYVSDNQKDGTKHLMNRIYEGISIL